MGEDSGKPGATAEVDPRGLKTADGRLLKVINHSLASAREMAGNWLACRPACNDCCVGPFPISQLDAWRLRRGLMQLAAAEPQRAAALRRRAEEAVRMLLEGFPGDPSTGTLTGDEAAEEQFTRAHASLPCPVLDPASGLCDLYEFRPLSCRTFGPPVRIGVQDLPPCRLCFQGASDSDVERCRVEPDPQALEDDTLRRFEATGAAPGETLIAFALVQPAG